MPVRHFRENNDSIPVPRGFDETYPYTFDLDPLPFGALSSPACRIEDPNGEDVTGDLLSGSASVDGTMFITPDFIPGVVETSGQYKLIWSVQIDGETWSGYGYIWFEE